VRFRAQNVGASVGEGSEYSVTYVPGCSLELHISLDNRPHTGDRTFVETKLTGLFFWAPQKESRLPEQAGFLD
jgi:hypothetical protein